MLGFQGFRVLGFRVLDFRVLGSGGGGGGQAGYEDGPCVCVSIIVEVPGA